MTTPDYKLTYFDARGLAEITRFIFAYANVPYKDVRISSDKEWPALRPKTPFRQIPLLEIDGAMHGQSTAFNRLLAKKYKLAGSTDEEQLQVDAIVDYFKDIWNANIQWWHHEQDPAKVAQLKDEYVQTKLEEHLEVLESHLKKSGGKFFAASGVTFADFAVAIILGTQQEKLPGVLEKHALLKEHVERVENLPGIKEWIARRPKTEV